MTGKVNGQADLKVRLYFGARGTGISPRITRLRNFHWPSSLISSSRYSASSRKSAWLRRNPWFEAELLPELRARVHALIDG